MQYVYCFKIVFEAAGWREDDGMAPRLEDEHLIPRHQQALLCVRISSSLAPKSCFVQRRCRVDRALQLLAKLWISPRFRRSYKLDVWSALCSVQQLNLSKMSCMLVDVETWIGHDNERVAGILSPTHR